jgi:hypothetical protein
VKYVKFRCVEVVMVQVACTACLHSNISSGFRCTGLSDRNASGVMTTCIAMSYTVALTQSVSPFWSKEELREQVNWSDIGLLDPMSLTPTCSSGYRHDPRDAGLTITRSKKSCKCLSSLIDESRCEKDDRPPMISFSAHRTLIYRFQALPCVYS